MPVAPSRIDRMQGIRHVGPRLTGHPGAPPFAQRTSSEADRPRPTAEPRASLGGKVDLARGPAATRPEIAQSEWCGPARAEWRGGPIDEARGHDQVLTGSPSTRALAGSPTELPRRASREGERSSGGDWPAARLPAPVERRFARAAPEERPAESHRAPESTFPRTTSADHRERPVPPRPPRPDSDASRRLPEPGRDGMLDFVQRADATWPSAQARSLCSPASAPRGGSVAGVLPPAARPTRAEPAAIMMDLSVVEGLLRRLVALAEAAEERQKRSSASRPLTVRPPVPSGRMDG
jgi:hypothetical protein